MHQYLCAECDGFMHLHASRREHSRGLVREKREEMVVDVKEGTARLKCAVAVLAVDLASGKAVLELKSNVSTAEAGGGATCRFCVAALLGDRVVPGRDACCSDPDCLDLDARACKEKLGCGHLCGGVVGEAPECLPCLRCAENEYSDADDYCQICFTDNLGSAPAIKVCHSSCSCPRRRCRSRRW